MRGVILSPEGGLFDVCCVQEVIGLKEALAAEGRRLGMVCGELGSAVESVAKDGGRAAAEAGRLRGRLFELEGLVEESERKAAEAERRGAAVERELEGARSRGGRAEGMVKELEGEVARRENAVRDVQVLSPKHAMQATRKPKNQNSWLKSR